MMFEDNVCLGSAVSCFFDGNGAAIAPWLIIFGLLGLVGLFKIPIDDHPKKPYPKPRGRTPRG